MGYMCFSKGFMVFLTSAVLHVNERPCAPPTLNERVSCHVSDHTPASRPCVPRWWCAGLATHIHIIMHLRCCTLSH